MFRRTSRHASGRRDDADQFVQLRPEQAAEVVLIAGALHRVIDTGLGRDDMQGFLALWQGAVRDGRVPTMVTRALRGDGVCHPAGVKKTLAWFQLRVPGLLQSLHKAQKAELYERLTREEGLSLDAARARASQLNFAALQHYIPAQGAALFTWDTGAMFHDWVVAGNVSAEMEHPAILEQLSALGAARAGYLGERTEPDKPRPRSTFDWLQEGQVEIELDPLQGGYMVTLPGGMAFSPMRRKVPDLRRFGFFAGLLAGVLWHVIDAQVPHVSAQALQKGYGAPGELLATVDGFQLIWLKDKRSVLYEGALRGLCLRHSDTAASYMRRGPVMSLRTPEGAVKATVALEAERKGSWRIADEKANQNAQVSEPAVRKALDKIYGYLGMASTVPAPPGLKVQHVVSWNPAIVPEAFAQGSKPSTQPPVTWAAVEASGWLKSTPWKVVREWLKLNDVVASTGAALFIMSLPFGRRAEIETTLFHGGYKVNAYGSGAVASATRLYLTKDRLSAPNEKSPWVWQYMGAIAQASQLFDLGRGGDRSRESRSIGISVPLDRLKLPAGVTASGWAGGLSWTDPQWEYSQSASASVEFSDAKIEGSITLEGVSAKIQLKALNTADSWYRNVSQEGTTSPWMTAAVRIELKVPQPGWLTEARLKKLSERANRWAIVTLMHFRKALWIKLSEHYAKWLHERVEGEVYHQKGRMEEAQKKLKRAQDVEKLLVRQLKRAGRRAPQAGSVEELDRKAIWLLTGRVV